MPLHVVQRGNNRGPIFRGIADLTFFRQCLVHLSGQHGVAVHAYVLMTNHVHMLVTPALATSLPRMMQGVGRVYVKYFNRVHERTGTLWEGRYKATIVENDSYLLTCMRYIELNPVRANIVQRPEDYPWSSFRANACGAPDDLVERHSLYETMGCSPEERCLSYRALFQAAIPERDIHLIRDSTQHAWALGSRAFRRTIASVSRRAERLPLGRPRKVVA
ncbi:MAG: transposase [Betaproteobacteria bacterium]